MSTRATCGTSSPQGSPTGDDVTLELVHAHDEDIVDWWNSVMSAEDVVWHLGDLTLKHTAGIADTLRHLNGRIRLVLGNPDHAHPLFR